MKTFYATAPWVGLTGSNFVTIALVAGFVIAPETRYAEFRTKETPFAATGEFAETISVTATRLVSNTQAKATSHCVTATC